MSNQKLSSTLVITWVALPGLAIFLGAGPARAQSSSANYTFLVAAGFLCDPGDSATCPAVVKSSNGDSYEMSGAGMFATQSKSVTAAGTFTHKSSGGNVLETGVWIASELMSFYSYGVAPGARMRGGRAFGPGPFAPMRSRMFSGSMPAGGLAVFRVRLLPIVGLPKTATLQVNCALAKVPPERQTEGIRLTLEGSGLEFAEEVGGRTLFVLTRPAARATTKSTAPHDETSPAPAEVGP